MSVSQAIFQTHTYKYESEKWYSFVLMNQAVELTLTFMSASQVERTHSYSKCEFEKMYSHSYHITVNLIHQDQIMWYFYNIISYTEYNILILT